MIKINFTLIFFILFCSVSKVFAQTEPKNPSVLAEGGLILSSNRATPFFLKANQYGLIPMNSQLMYLNIKVKKDYDSSDHSYQKIRHFDTGYGIEAQANAGLSNQLLLPQLYVKARFHCFQIYVGRKREIQGLVDTAGTMGSYIWSGNALPMPKVDISIPNFVPIMPNKLISIKGNFSHGWFGSTDSLKKYYLHQTSLYIRLGKPEWRFKFHWGLNHQAQWAGSPTVPLVDKLTGETITKYGSDFKSFLDVVFAKSMTSSGGNTISNQTGVASNEAGNRTGNHLGTMDLGFEYQAPLWKIFCYRQNLYDDGSLYYLNNFADGLYGYSMSKKQGRLRRLTIEYLHTSNQGGAIFSDAAAELRGADNYFNNSVYKDGWTYKGNVIGTPYMQTYGELNRNLKLNDPKNFFNNFVINNRVKALYVSYSLMLDKIQNSGKISLSSNLGNYSLPFAYLTQVSILQSFQMRYDNKTIIYGSLAADFGKLFPTNVGAKLSVKRELR